MATYKLELGPMIPGVPGVSTPSWDVFVAAGADALPGTGTSLGTVDHDAVSDPLNTWGPSHVAVHHVQEILYRRSYPTGAAGTFPFFPYNFTDMSQIKIRRHGPLMNATALTATSISVVIAATATIVLKYQPGDVAAPVADHYFNPGNTAIATVSSVGVVTGVAVGSTYVHVVNKFNGLIVDVPVTVTAAELLGRDGEEDEEKSRASKKAADAKEAKETKEAKEAKKSKEEDDDNEKVEGDARLSKLSTKK